MKRIFIFFLLIGLSHITIAQIITIMEAETNQAIEFATLITENPKLYAVTNINGQADITGFKGLESIEIRSLGYKTKILSYAQIEENDFEIFLDASNINLDEVIVSATRWKQKSSNVPSKIISISPIESTIKNPQTAADLLSISGKVYIQKSQQGGGSPMIRGFATNRLLYTIDGVRMNTAIFRGGNIQNVISLDPFAMESTEVLFGPGSVIYGSDAIGGVMSFQTLIPELTDSENPNINGSATTRYSSANNEKTGHFDVNVGWKKWAFVTSISSFDFDHLRQGSKGPDDYIKPYYVQRIDNIDRVVNQNDELLQIPTAYSQINLMQKIRFKPNDKIDLQYGFHYSETSPYGRYDRHNRIKNGTARYAEWNYGPQKWMMNNLNISHISKNTIYDELTLRMAVQEFQESRIDRSLNSDNRSIRVEDVDAYSLNLDFIKSIGIKNTLFYGAEYILNDVTSTGIDEDISTGLKLEGPSRYPQSKWSSVAIYLNNEYKVSDKLRFQAGLRYNQFMIDADFDTSFYPFPFTEANINDGALTGSIGTVYRPNDTWVINFNFGTAFRAPNVDDIGKVFDSEPGSVIVPNPDLKAEYAYNFDFGIAKIFDDLLKVDLSAYYTILQNALVRRDFTLNGLDSIMYNSEMSKVQAIQNAAKAKVYGIQAGIELKLPKGFGFSTDLNYQKGEEELDDGSTSPSRHAAPFFGKSEITYRSGKLRIQLYSNYQAERKYEDLPVDEQDKDEIYAKDTDGNNYSPAWYTINLKAMYQLNEMFSINAGIENLTGQRYRPYSSGISGAGRNFVFSIRASF